MNRVDRGKLHVYLGAAPGVGKTYAMLGEGHRRLERGQDVVIGLVESHERPLTQAMAEGLELVPAQRIEYRGREFTEMDVDAVLARGASVVLVDELAHSNVPGARNTKRWEDVQELLDAGVKVITTVNIQHLESLNDVVESITGVTQRETIPDEIVRRADQIELVDMSPDGLRRRLAHGNVYPPEKIDAALGSYFRAGNLTALRELALLWVADRVEEGLETYRSEHRIDTPWPARERIVVAITGGPESATVIRRAGLIAGRSAGGELFAVRVTRSDGLAYPNAPDLAATRQLVESLGGSFHQVVGDEVAAALIDFARGVNATQLVLGSSRRRGWQQFFGLGTAQRIQPLAGDIDVHLVSHEAVRGGRLPVLRRGIGRRRRLAGWLLASLGQPLLVSLLLLTRPAHGLETEMLLFLLVAVGTALLGGIAPAVLGSLFGAVLLNFFFTDPLHTLLINDSGELLALLAFPLVSGTVAAVVDLAARRTAQATRAGAEAETLASLAGSVLRGARPLPALVERVAETFGMRSVTLLERDETAGAWTVRAHAGADPACARPAEADTDVRVRDGLVLAIRGAALSAADRRVLEAFVAHIAAAVERESLAEQASAAGRLAEADRVKTALLRAVSHDLRTPIATVKAQAGTLRQLDGELAESDRRELLDGIETAVDKLDGLVANLLDMSRVQAGAVTPITRTVYLDEVIPPAVAGIADQDLRLALPEQLPPVRTDPGLLERALANIVENAVRHNPPDRSVLITASALADRLEVHVIDRGPGVDEEAKARMFEPFQRLGDAPAGSGVGLGLAVARGFVDLLGGTLEPQDTPGGGLTLVISLPVADGADFQAVSPAEPQSAGGTEPGRTGESDGAESAGTAG